MVEKFWKIASNGDAGSVVSDSSEKRNDASNVVNDLMMVAEEDPLSFSQAKAYRRELLFAKTFSLLLSEDGINPKDFDEDLELEYGCKLDDVFKVSHTAPGFLKFIVPSNLIEARAMLQAKYQSILKAPLVASGAIPDKDEPSSQQSLNKSAASDKSSSVLQKKRSPNVKRTYGRSGVNSTSEEMSSPPAKKTAKSNSSTVPSTGKSSTEPPLFSSITDIESHYYASIKGSDSYTESKGKFLFECCVCNETLPDNVAAVSHMHTHLGDSSGSSACQCETCYRWFMSEAERELHQEDHSFGNSTYVCRICDSDSFLDLADLGNHMQSTHVRREMPYACRLCGYRSSLYVDTVNHFNTAHAGSTFAQCAFCLQVYQLKPSAAGGPCRTANFYDHISRHIGEKESQANCYRCRLSFLGFGDLPRHEKLEHKPGNSIHCVTRFTVAAGKTGSGKSQNETTKTQEMDLSRVNINLPSTSSTNGPALCRECSQPMAKKGHFGRYTTCSVPSCAFTSACTFAMANHLSRHRKPQAQADRNMVPQLKKPLFCQCGFQASVGAVMAAHLVSCSLGSRSCSTVPTIGTSATEQMQ